MAKLSGKSNQQSTGVVVHQRYGYSDMFLYVLLLLYYDHAQAHGMFCNDAVSTSNGLKRCVSSQNSWQYQLRITSALLCISFGDELIAFSAKFV